MSYEYSVQLVDSQELSRHTSEQTFSGQNWRFRGVEETLKRMTDSGWEHYQSLEITGNNRWKPDNYSKHGVLLFFKRKIFEQKAEAGSIPACSTS